MAKPAKKQSETNITRISATDSASKQTVRAAKPAKTNTVPDAETTKSVKADRPARRSRNPLVAIGRYFKGAWYELRQVRWPDRRATWSMTGALIAFTLFFVVVILILDYGFAQLFKLIMGTN